MDLTRTSSLSLNLDLSELSLEEARLKLSGQGPEGDKAFDLISKVAEIVNQIDEATGHIRLVIENNGGNFTTRADISLSNVNKIDDEALNKKVQELGMSVRTLNVLKKHTIYTLRDLACHSEEQYTEMRGLGPKGLMEIRDTLVKYGLNFGSLNK